MCSTKKRMCSGIPVMYQKFRKCDMKAQSKKSGKYKEIYF